MKRYFRLYGRFLNQYIKTLIEYRADFVLGLIGFILVQFTGVVFVKLIFNNIPSLQGWSFYEILFIYGFAQIPRGIDHVFTDNLWMLSGRIIVQGQFDRYLLRPLNPLFQLIAERFQPDGFGEIIIGFILVVISSIQLSLNYTPFKILMFIIAVLCAIVIYTAIKLAVASIAFWIKFAQSYLYMTYQLSDFAKYPMGIYPKAIRGVLTFIIPFAFTGYYPGAYLLGKGSIITGVLLTAVVAVVSITVAYCIWLKGMSLYESSGS
ncbi:MAG: ABC-2 family transporter protein [Inconstantimicrobium porci]|uniref:ABC transporter permease n=1 Tax=Inconstantimicrobium porci TaxID=2652291 RepID=UPI002A90CC60|nr:ABC-2 family transporter protein [Inconstantimicrobium porci]MDY5911690.1 ABC-2 family transporter protein [Inconstantimicrobium porci]